MTHSTSQLRSLMMVMKMRMIHLAHGHTRLDMMMNEVTKEKVRVTPIEEKIRDIKLRWF